MTGIQATRLPFHLAMPVAELEEIETFFVEQLNCSVGRKAETWVDIDFFGHQISFHKGKSVVEIHNEVDSDDVPVPHFGVVLPWDQWQELGDRLTAAKAKFRLTPRIRFKGEVGEQGTFFVEAPGYLVLEFKTFRHEASLFASE